MRGSTSFRVYFHEENEMFLSAISSGVKSCSSTPFRQPGSGAACLGDWR